MELPVVNAVLVKSIAGQSLTANNPELESSASASASRLVRIRVAVRVAGIRTLGHQNDGKYGKDKNDTESLKKNV
jgi:hypothetical protein